MSNKRFVSDKFGSTLKYWREKRGYSLQDICNMTGVSTSYINRLEMGFRKAPSVPIANKIAKALGIPPSTLLNISETANENLQTLAELILYNDFCLREGEVIKSCEREKLVEIIEFILYEWNNEDKLKNVVELSELIDDFKQGIAM